MIEFQSGASFTVAGSVLYEGKNMLYLVSVDHNALPMIGIVEEENGQDRIDILDVKDPENKESVQELMALFQAEAKSMIERVQVMAKKFKCVPIAGNQNYVIKVYDPGISTKF